MGPFDANLNINAQPVIYVKFDDERTGQEQRQRNPIYSDGTPIFPLEFEYNLVSRRGYGQAAKAKLIQFPLNLCYAQTAHRMQGQTVKAGTKVVLHWSKRMQNGMAYSHGQMTTYDCHFMD